MFDLKEFMVAVVAVIIAAYILNYFGYLNHSSPLRAFNGKTNAVRRNATRNVTCAGGVCTTHTSVSAGNIGATELSSATSIRPL